MLVRSTTIFGMLGVNITADVRLEKAPSAARTLDNASAARAPWSSVSVGRFPKVYVVAVATGGDEMSGRGKRAGTCGRGGREIIFAALSSSFAVGTVGEMRGAMGAVQRVKLVETD